jgi:hypothetical protein
MLLVFMYIHPIQTMQMCLALLRRCLIPEAEEEPPKELPVWDEAMSR